MKRSLGYSIAALLASAALAVPGVARADIVIGAVLSTTGPASSLGIPERNVLEMMPKTIAGQNVRIVVLDDASDTTAAVKAAQKLIDEQHVDIILGPSSTPNALAILEVIGPAMVPTICMAGSSNIIDPPEGNRRWMFKLAPTEAIMLALVGKEMKAKHENTMSIIKTANAFGDAMSAGMEKVDAADDVKVLGTESFNLTDMSVTPQVLKMMGARPQSVFVASSGTPGAMPIIELRNRGYAGTIYSNQGIANPDVLRVGGKSLEGVLLPVSPVLVAEQLPDSNPIKAISMDYIKMYEGKYGAGSRSLFGATMYDGYLLLERAVPEALKAGQPGTQAFRTGLRDAMEHERDLVGTQAVFNLTPQDHSGADERAQVLVQIKDNTWALAK
jgi:branched-chain amino acid transport system substrate-binding protein